MRTRNLMMVSASALALATAPLATAQADEVEVVHWWTSGGEAAALSVLKDNLEDQGIEWQDSAVAGGGGAQARTALQARLAAGNPPTAMQMLGLVIHDWAREGVLGNLNELAEEEGWDDVVPEALQFYSKWEGNWVAAPVNIHSTNWVWANASLFEEIGADVPETWDEFVAVAEQFQEAGIQPIAHGGQAWQEATIFDGAVLSAGGPEFYREAMIELDEEALTSDTMVEAFEQLRTIRGFVDDDFPGRDWNLASAMVIEGEAAMQIMGDWAKGEFINAGMEAGEDFLCFRYPGSAGSVTFNSDQFAMFQVGEDARDAQSAMASAIMDPSFQASFNQVKGSAPARTDVSHDGFDACGVQAMEDIVAARETDTLMGSMAHGHAAGEAIKGAFEETITNFFNSDMAAEEAVEVLAQQVRMSQF